MSALAEAAQAAMEITLVRVEPRTDGTALLSARISRFVPEDPNRSALLGRLVRVTWYEPREVMTGDSLIVTLKLRRPWSYANPGAFDYAGWLYANHFVAAGYIKQVHEHQRRRGGEPRLLERLHSLELVHSGLLSALTLGDRQGVSDAAWQRFRHTGTLHLMVISGLHVGIACLLAFGICTFFLRCCGQGIPAHAQRRLALGASIATALVYLGLVGAQPAVTRAALMSTLTALALMIERRLDGWRVLAISGVASVLVHPGMLLTQGFVLSYVAVACLLYYFSRRRETISFVRALVACQLVLALGLMPWQGVVVGDVPVIAPFANLLVMPLMTLLVIPSALLGVAVLGLGLESLAYPILRTADIALSLFLAVLDALTSHALVSTDIRFGYFSMRSAVLAVVAFGLAALPLNTSVRAVSLIGWLTLALAPLSPVPHGEFRVHVLDVGQGSAAFVDTARHRLVIDTGPRFPSGFDLGEAVVIPSLRATGRPFIDQILLSHLDIDHAGGWPAIARYAPSAPTLGATGQCRPGNAWEWDGVRFRILYDEDGKTENDRSCVLLVDNGRARALLPGDIGAESEARLLPNLSNVDFVVVPHHGSMTSSSSRFVRELAPCFAVVSAGQNNRYGHPHPLVVKRFETIGARVLVTAEQGAVGWQSDTKDRVWTARSKQRLISDCEVVPPDPP